jgi:hypothetical protein
MNCGAAAMAPAVKIRSPETENTGHHIPVGCAANSSGVACPGPERPSVPHPEEHPTSNQVAADRLRLIEQRLQSHFYEVTPASEQIAESVLADLNDLEKSATRLSF